LPKGENLTIKQPSASQGTTQQSGSISAASRLKLAIKANKWRLTFLAFIVVYAYLLTLSLGYMSPQWDEMPHLYGGLLLTRGQTHAYLSINGYYPPFFDLITAGYLETFGASTAAGRLVSVTFALLAVWVVFEFSKRAYGAKNAIIATVLLAATPGFVWVSRITLLETILIFFFTLVMFLFYTWITNNSNKALILSGLALGIGILAKYQILVAALAMLVSILFLCRKRLKISLAKLIVIVLIAILVVAPWFVMIYQFAGSSKFQAVLYVVQVGGQNRPSYSNRFFIPVFYLIEMSSPFNGVPVNPVSVPIMALGLCGLGLFAYRRKKQDVFLVTWFIVVYAFFTAIPDRQWRYVDVLFPILAISAASFIAFLYGKVRSWKPKMLGTSDARLRKLAAGLFIFLAASAIAYSSYNAYQMTAKDEINIPIQAATNYLAGHLDQNQSAVIVCASNLLYQDMFWFYMPANMTESQIWQYPELPVDTFTPNFNITQFVNLCEQQNVKYIILYDYGSNTPFYNSTLTYADIQRMIYNTGRFGVPTDQPFFGQMPNRLFLVRFNQTQT
jgi:4-amino-4-deoxy-L-arabinose transferase-like glycosyltransferase